MDICYTPAIDLNIFKFTRDNRMQLRNNMLLRACPKTIGLVVTGFAVRFKYCNPLIMQKASFDKRT